MGLSIPHILMVLAIVVLVFGTKRLKNVGGDLGEAIKGFRNAVKEDDELNAVSNEDGEILKAEIAGNRKDKV